ncbi:MAG: glycosyltransferase family 2 protein [Planctomycetes bacterium]|nr:glycosyltransferase family 2 protein [Planctomycetota bacterium]
MPRISACIISYNEEERIEDCLRSLRGVVDEIVLVDSLSTDRTLEIAAPYVDKLVHQAFLGHVEQKNLAFDEASHDWVLSLDCDERLTPELAASILAHKEALERHAAWELTRKTFYVYRWLDHAWYPEWRVRLFDRRRARNGGTNPHDKVIVREGTVGRLDGDLLHLSYPSLSHHLRTMDHFTEVAARELVAKGKRVSLLTPFTHSTWKFVRLYVLERAFLDGFAGFTVSLLSGVHVFVKYAKVLCLRYRDAATRPGTRG